MSNDIVTLPPWLYPRSRCDAVRVGSKHDGGYVIDSESIKTSKYLLSFGIGENFDFEKQWLIENISSIHSFDGSVSLRYYVKQLVKYIFLFPLAPNRFFYYIYKSVSFGRFVSNKKVLFFNKYVGIDTRLNTIEFEDAIFTFGKLKSREIFLKIDIEGGEYRILEKILISQKYFSGLAIEFHDFDLHKSRIKDFISKLEMEIVAVNVNNSAPVLQFDFKKLEPSVLEITFTPFDSKYKPNNWRVRIAKNDPRSKLVTFSFE